MSGQTQFDSFERLYRHREDPWKFASSDYEREKYGVTLGYLSKTLYRRAFEPGCAEGVFTAQLAFRCDALIGMDISPTAAARARQRCSGLRSVEILTGDLRHDIPEGRFDLVIFSELGYYFAEPTLDAICTDLAVRLLPGGEFVATHWLGTSADHTLTGDQVHSRLLEILPLTWDCGERRDGYRIDRWHAA